jgi:hypothetical protein
MVFCTASIWHGSKDKTVFGVGGDKVVSKFSSGLRSDDEAFKKAFTDAITNALKLIGVGGDVHMGRFDDSKYVSALTAEFNEPKHVTHDTMPDDIADVPEHDVIERDDGIQILTVDAQRPIFSELQNELIACETVDECKRWGIRAKSRASRLSGNWHKMLQAKYIEHLRSIEKRDAIEYVDKATA